MVLGSFGMVCVCVLFFGWLGFFCIALSLLIAVWLGVVEFVML